MTEPRKREIAAVVTSLARFQPTRVAVECPAALVNERYAKFLDGKLENPRNEVIQLCFKLARERKLPEVLGLDVKGDFPFGEVAEWADKNGRKQEIAALMAFGARETEHISQLQNKTAIGARIADIWPPQIVAEKAGRIYFLDAHDVEYLAAAGNYLVVRAGSNEYLTHATLKRISVRLAPLGFFQIERSLLINIAQLATTTRALGR